MSLFWFAFFSSIFVPIIGFILSKPVLNDKYEGFLLGVWISYIASVVIP